jgi:hypothetical protein
MMGTKDLLLWHESEFLIFMGQSLFLCDTSAADPAAFDMLLLIIGLDVILKVSS